MRKEAAAVTCSVEGCVEPLGQSGAKGMCPKHYTRVHRHGDPHHSTRPMMRGGTLAERFWSKVDTSDGLYACWPWTASTFRERYGYGKFQTGDGRANMRADYAHRVALELACEASIPEGMEVRHSCDNPPCCNPHHLRIGTHAENMADMASRDRRKRG